MADRYYIGGSIVLLDNPPDDGNTYVPGAYNAYHAVDAAHFDTDDGIPVSDVTGLEARLTAIEAVNATQPTLIVDTNIESVNLSTTPVTWDVEAGYDYHIKTTGVNGWATLTTSARLVLRMETAGGVVSGATDYRYGGLKHREVAGFVDIDVWDGSTRWPLNLFRKESAPRYTHCEANVYMAVSQQTRNISYGMIAFGYQESASEYIHESYSGWMFEDAGANTIIKGHILTEDNEVMSAGVVQVYRLPRLS